MADSNEAADSLSACLDATEDQLAQGHKALTSVTAGGKTASTSIELGAGDGAGGRWS